MKILKAYAAERDKKESYGTDSPLIREIRKKYDYTECVFPADMSDEEKADVIREYDVLLTMWASPKVPISLGENPGKLKYICNITGGMRDWIGIELVESEKITVTNWGDAPAHNVAEGAFALLMAMMKDIPMHIKNANNNGHIRPEGLRTASLFNTKVGIFGMGMIGKKFVEMLRPFGGIMYAYDPYVEEFPENVTRADSLEELFSVSQIIVIHAGLTEETTGIITGELLAKLPDGGIIINTARGAIIDAAALEKEIASGRLRAGLDVFYPVDMPPDGSKLRRADNCILTAHHVSVVNWGVNPELPDVPALICLDNLDRFEKGKELKFIITPQRYKLMT